MTKLRCAEAELKGADLKKLGVEEGPFMGKALAMLLEGRLDGQIKNVEDEKEAIKRLLADKKGKGRLKKQQGS